MDAKKECEEMTETWIKFENATTNTFNLVSSLTTECFSNDKDNGGLATELFDNGFNEDEVLALIHDLIIAAADTTSYSTLWSLYLLASNPTIQEKARNEVGKLPQNKLLLRENLPYLHWCNKESMRMFPVAPFLTRILDKPIKLSEEWNEEILKKDQLILMSSYAMSRNDKYFESPERFWPERWERVEKKQLRGVSGDDGSFASLPFGHGARRCIGIKIAENQMTYFLARVLQTFKFQSENKNEVKYQMKLIGMPDQPIHVSLSKAS